MVRADELRKELERVKAKKAAMASSGSAENMGRGAETIRRDRHGRRLEMLEQVCLNS